MTAIERAIKEAVEKGGYDWLNTVEDIGHRNVPAAPEKSLLDPLFWQALSKARGWKTKWGSCPACFITGFGKRSSECECVANSWKEPWHRFIDHLAAGENAESFFASIL